MNKDYSYYDEDGIKRNLALRLSRLNLGNNLMKRNLEITFHLSIDQLESIYNNLSENQKNAKSGLAIKEIIDFKKDYL
jgi:hypothetical protein